MCVCACTHEIRTPNMLITARVFPSEPQGGKVGMRNHGDTPPNDLDRQTHSDAYVIYATISMESINSRLIKMSESSEHTTHTCIQGTHVALAHQRTHARTQARTHCCCITTTTITAIQPPHPSSSSAQTMLLIIRSPWTRRDAASTRPTASNNTRRGR